MLPRLKKNTASGKLLHSTGSSAQCSVMTLRGGIRGCDGREAEEGRAVCIHAADSPCCSAETNNTVKQLYSNKKEIKLPAEKR